MKLILGVLDVAYSDAHGSSGGATTTGEVAEILENKYHVMETFFEVKKKLIAHDLAEGFASEIRALANGKPRGTQPFQRAEQEIEKRFRRFLDDDEMSAILPITQQITAAQMGVNHRKKASVNKGNAARPAFIDTGLYQASFRAEVEK